VNQAVSDIGRKQALRASSPAEEKGLPACLNCGALLTGPFCAACGQRDVPSYPSLRELIIDAFSELSGWDGRLASTVRALVRHPGLLTREFLEGRRARYISPLRFYLVASLAYFLVAATAPNVTLSSGRTLFMGLHVGAAANGKVTGSGSGGTPGAQTLSPEDKAVALEQIERSPALVRPFLRRAVADPAGFRRGLLEALPRMFFVLLPVFAGIVALFYHGRKYPEHLYFAIHLHAFIFLALAACEALKFTRSFGILVVAALLVLVGIPIYATIAFRRVYGGSLAATVAKEVAIAVIYCAVSFATFVATIYWVSIVG